MYDLVNEVVLSAKEVPRRAVVVPGSRTVESTFARDNGLSLIHARYCKVPRCQNRCRNYSGRGVAMTIG